MKYIKIIVLLSGIMFMTACSDYLDIVPDDVPSMDNAFSNRTAAEKFLFTCFSYLPDPTDVWSYPAHIGGDEMWWNIDQSNFFGRVSIKIANGEQNSNAPYLNFWDGGNSGKNLFIAIRDCNIFLENIHKPQDLDDYERIIWTAEVKFLKAYYHLFLMQLYGPIPIIKENLLVSATPDEVRAYRDPVDDVVAYIAELIDEAIEDLPMEITNITTDAGRITIPIALAVKAQAYVWAASPLFNGNSDYKNFKDNRGIQLIPAEYDATKWETAAKALKEAIDVAHNAGHKLYEYIPPRAYSEETKLKYAYRLAITEKFNPEIIWPSTRNDYDLQRRSSFRTVSGNVGGGRQEYCATLKVAEQYYTYNGIPIDEDPNWDYSGRYDTQVAGEDHQFYIRTGQTTAKLNFNREPRFYASLGFDRCVYEGMGKTDETAFNYILGRAGEVGGFQSVGEHIPTGYYLKKVVHPESASATTTSFDQKRYSFPVIRLADLYLLYAEALNEIKSAPDNEVYTWIDTVRERAGLDGVVESWKKSSIPSKPTNKEGMREIIHQERLIELAFEGHRFYDLRRWKKAMQYLNEPVQGWDYKGSNVATYYTVTTYMNTRTFNMRDYLWPLKISTLIVNSNFEQNPGWN